MAGIYAGLVCDFGGALCFAAVVSDLWQPVFLLTFGGFVLPVLNSVPLLGVVAPHITVTVPVFSPLDLPLVNADSEFCLSFACIVSLTRR